MLWSVFLFANVKWMNRAYILILQIEHSVAAEVICNFKVHVDVRCDVGMKFIFSIWLNTDRGKKSI